MYASLSSIAFSFIYSSTVLFNPGLSNELMCKATNNNVMGDSCDNESVSDRHLLVKFILT
jgi:hypothetical protein